MIEVESLTKTFGSITAVDGLTFRVARGEILGFLGPNGAGKTTTMRILTGYMPATRGTARVAGFDVATDSLDVRRRVGYLPESVPVYPERAVLDYLSFVADVKSLPRKGKTQAIARVIERCGLGDVRRRTVGRLSRGYRQRVGLAQALIGDPPVLVLDEPTVGLDPAQVVEVRQLIRSLAGDRTVILSTHILPEVSQITSRVLIIDRGRIAAQGTSQELTAQLRDRQGFQVRVLGEAAQAEAVLSSVAGVVGVAVLERGDHETTFRVEAGPGADVRGAMARALVGKGLELLEMSPLAMSLEEIFISLVRRDGPPPAAGDGRAGAPPGEAVTP
jgi:ABC-2 type transport system ATP-binding protein